MTEPVLWTPSEERVRGSRMFTFMEEVNRRHGTELSSYDDLHRWSIEHLADFWSLVAEWVEIRFHARAACVVDDPGRLPGARWFDGATLNFAENLMRRTDDGRAIIFSPEGAGTLRVMTWRELHHAVSLMQQALRASGVVPGDRVVGYLPNLPETVVAMLAATSLGAIWSSCSPDFGVRGVLDRFARIQPKVLVAADGYTYGGRVFDSLEKTADIVAELEVRPAVVIVPYLESLGRQAREAGVVPGAIRLDAFTAPYTPQDVRFTAMPFEHPLYIMYSSGTTGLPKCIVQSAGGVLINQLKEHVLHVDIGPPDNLFYFTTCGWMMWNWQVAALGAGASITLFDGLPFHPDPLALPRLAEQSGVSVFGASARYFASLEREGVVPAQSCRLSGIRTVLSTGSPLVEESFDWIYRAFTPDAQLASISGGTDLNGCFVGGSPLLPVRRGEIQCRMLGMDVHAFDDDGRPVIGMTGELVCTQAFPSMPLFFWGDNETGSAYRAAYFERFEGVWCHGDFIEINGHGGIRIFGRSDATLNPGGVRIGTAEIYRQVEPIDGVVDSLVIGQQWNDDVRVILFVRLADGRVLDDEFRQRIRAAIRAHCSPRHVPAKIIQVADIPYTISQKKVELAVRDIVHGRPVRNRDALRNPESLDLFRDLPELREA